MALNENDNSIKGAYEDFDLAFMDEIFSDYFSENKGFFKIHDKKQQKIPVINIYKIKNCEDKYSDTDIFIIDIALGLYSKEDFCLEMIEDHGRYFFSITVNKKELPEDFEPLVKQISTNYGRRVIEFSNMIDSARILDTNDISGIIRVEIITKHANYKWNTLNVLDKNDTMYYFKK